MLSKILNLFKPEKIELDPKALWLDVREHAEVARHSLPSATVIPLSTDLSTIKKQCKSFDRTIYVFCQSGMRAKTATSKLHALGYHNAQAIGGIQRAKTLYAQREAKSL